MSADAGRGDADLWPRVSRCLDRVYAVEGDARIALLEQLAAEDPVVHREVLALLAADPGTSRLLVDAAHGAAAALPPTEAGTGPWLGKLPDEATVSIGGWRLLRPIGRGGMGEVYLAERSDGAFEQRAALKLLKRGLDSEEILARFLRERQILARLAHPGIARLFDGGVASDGRPYFVLEHVEGLPLNEHAAVARLDVTGRLRLFLDVCDAVEAAHHSLVVHRDLKPSNVLVSATGEVKLLDFGIAKLLETEPGADATRTELRMLTPAYAAPEQILGGAVTTATDVFALGAMLYELLADVRPFRREGRTPTDLAREVERERLVRPSEVLARRAGEAISPDERDALRHRSKRVAGDLDAILLQALETDPQRRYATVAALAGDVRLYLEGRPITARSDTFAYRARKFVRRHRLGLAATALAASALVAGTGVALWQAYRAERALERAERVRSFLVSVFEVSDPAIARGETVTARRLLDEGARRIETELAGAPELEAEMLDLLAGLYRKLGALEPARELATRALEVAERGSGSDSLAAARSRWTLGWVLLNQGELDRARPLLERALARLDRATGADGVLAADAREPLVELEFASHGPSAALPVALRRLEVYRRELGDEHAKTAMARNDLGVIYNELGRTEEAQRELAASAAALERSAGPNDPRLGLVLANLSDAEQALGEFDRAEASARRALEVRRRALGDRHLETGISAVRLATILLNQGRAAEAEPLAREGVELVAEADRFAAAGAIRVLARVLASLGEREEARARFDDAVRRFEELLGPAHFLALDARTDRAAFRATLPGQHDAAVDELARLAEQLASLGPDAELARAKAVAALARARAAV